MLRLKLNLKHNDLVRKLEADCREKIKSLFIKLSEMSRKSTSLNESTWREIQLLFASLPLNFRIALFNNEKLFPESLIKAAKKFLSTSDKAALRERMGQLMGVAYFNRERAEKEYFSSFSELPTQRKEKRETARAALNVGLSQIPTVWMTDPLNAKLAIERTLKEFPRCTPDGFIFTDAVIKDDQHDDVAEESEKSSGSEPGVEVLSLEQEGLRFESSPARTLEDLRGQITKVKGMDRFNTGQREKLARKILDVAEKAGVALASKNGVYYWVWFIANKKGVKIIGDNFGKTHASKDLDRLLLAIEKAMPKSVMPVKKEVLFPPADPALAVEKKEALPIEKSPLAEEIKLVSPRPTLLTSTKKEDPLPTAADMQLTISTLRFLSLDDLRTQVMEIHKALGRFNPTEIESLLSASLEAAIRGGVSLSKSKGVYYWIWFIAHQKNSRVGGDNFGRVHAPKDIERLLQAIDKAKAV